MATVDLLLDGIDFPHAAQVYRLRRDFLGADRRHLTKQVVFGITCLPTDQAGPAQLVALIRGHWAVECVHWVRAVLYREDSSPLIDSAAQTMATFRNIAVATIRLSGDTRITSATRSMSHDINRALTLIGLWPGKTTLKRPWVSASYLRASGTM